MKTAHVFISGFVQGVGFRHFVRSKARELGLFGWVKNLSDNRVEALLQGEKGVIEKMVETCRKGPFLSEVKNIEIVWEDAKTPYNSFDIII